MSFLNSWQRNAWRVFAFVSIWILIQIFYRWVEELQFSEFHMIVTATFLLHQCVFWFFCASLAYLDLTESPQRMYKYKVQKTKVEWTHYLDCFRVVIFNQFGLLLPMLALAYPVFMYCGVRPSSQFPTIWIVLRDILVFILVEEVCFYYGHRLLHIPFLYRKIHKMHHLFSSPVGAACEYAHPLEHIFVNVLPLMCGPLLMGSHLSLMWFWLTLAMLSTINGHSGYAFPYTPFDEEVLHDYHHLAFKDNYGAVGLLDWLHGTRKEPARNPSRFSGIPTN